MTTQKVLASSVVRTPTDPVRLDQGETVHVGVDVPKATYHGALSSGTRGLLTTWVPPARPEVLSERRRPIRDQVAQVVSEAGPTGFSWVHRLRAAGDTAQVLAPAKLRVAAGPDAKGDRLDGRRLAGRAQ